MSGMRMRRDLGEDAAHAGTAREWATRGALALAIAGSALAVGSVHTTTLCAVTAVLAVAAALAWWGTEPTRVRSSATLLVFTGIGLTAYTALQCVPLPIHVLAAIAPHNADVWSRALAPLHEAGPAWAPISLDPVATRIEVLKGVAYLLAFVTALKLARNRNGVEFVSGVLTVTGLLLAAAALLHPAFGTKKLFGLYEPPTSMLQRHVAPLMNPNNLAGYLNLALCAALSRGLSREPRFPRPLLLAASLILMATQLWVASRGGVATMVLGVLLVLGVTYLGRSTRRRGIGASLSMGAGVAAACGAALAVLGASEDAANELFDTDSSKLVLFRRVLHMLPSVPFFGCGRGAFESAFPAFRSAPGYVTFAYPENVVAQWVLEWGVPVGLGALALVAVALRPNAMFVRPGIAGGAWAGLVTLAVQNLGDLGTEIPGLMLGAAVCAAMVAGGTPGRSAAWKVERWTQRPEVVSLAAAAAALCAIVGAAVGIGRELHDDQRNLRAAALVEHVDAGRMHQLARAAMLRHPAEPYLPFITALRASAAHDDNPVPWVGATLERAGTYGPAHLVLARALVKRSPSQARLEYRLAVEQAPGLVGAVMAEAPSLVRSYDDALELVPSGDAAPGVLATLVLELANELPAAAVRLDADLAARLPTAAQPKERAARAAVEDVEVSTAAPWCEPPMRDACLRTAVDKASALLAVDPDACAGHLLRARALLAQGHTDALAALATSAERVHDRVQCLRGLVVLSQGVGDVARADATLEHILNAGCNTEEECANQVAWVADFEERRGHSARALALFTQSCERNPTDSCLEGVARLASAQGLHIEAADAYERLSRSHPDQRSWAAAAARERTAATWNYKR
jgi:tetratricopeptide (TPR) repeat protein